MLAVRTEEGPEPRNADTFPISFPGGSGLARGSGAEMG